MEKQIVLARILFLITTIPALIVIAIIPVEAVLDALFFWAVYAFMLFVFHIHWESTPCHEP